MSDAESPNLEQSGTPMSPLTKSVHEMLNEEKWTRATLSNYSTSQFKELDTILKEAREGRLIDELKKACDEHLQHTKNSIIALYLSGMVALSRQIIDDSAMVNLVSIFVDSHKWNIVKYLCERILDHGESKYALRTLVDCMKSENEEESIYPVLERLVKADFEDAENAKLLADHFKKLGQTETAVEYYKKALHRYINKQLFANVREIWEKLLEDCPEDIDFFLHVQKKIAKTISEDKAVILLKDVYAVCKNNDKEIDTSIEILKIVLQYDEKDVQARREIVECYRKKYAEHSRLEECVRVSNLEATYRNCQEAIAEFEKHIAFDKGNFVFHRTWGVGRIAAIEGDDIRIDFAKKRDHTMGLKMAVDALQTLAKNHIWVLKATWKKEKLHDKVKEDISWALKTVIKSFGNSCDLKRIKAELSPAVLTAGEWSSWSTKARDILKMDSSFGVSPENTEVFSIRERPITVAEKLYNKFRAERNFFDRAATLRDFVSQKDFEDDSEYFIEMLGYFTGFLRAGNLAGEQAAASFLLVKELSNKCQLPAGSLTINFPEVFAVINNVPALYKTFKDARLKEDFLRHIQQFIPDWPAIFVKLFPYALSPGIIAALEKESCDKELSAMANNCFENYRENKEAVVWLFKNASTTPWFKAANISYEKQLITLIHVLELSYRDIENHRETNENRKTSKQVHNILFKEGYLDTFFESASDDTVTAFFTFINDVKDLDPQDKLNLRSKIMDKRPNLKFIDEEKKNVSSLGLTVTAAKLEEKQKQLTHIMEEEVPANSKELAFALSLGDLRENAEYHAAKEKQEHLNSQVAKLKEEIERAQIFDPKSINTSKVSFGTKVVLRNETRNQTEEYTILGPWESDPEHNIISYLSPFGSAILNMAAGERFEFANNEEKLSYVVEQISAVSF